jgi:hypothetical protein
MYVDIHHSRGFQLVAPAPRCALSPLRQVVAVTLCKVRYTLCKVNDVRQALIVCNNVLQKRVIARPDVLRGTHSDIGARKGSVHVALVVHDHVIVVRCAAINPREVFFACCDDPNSSDLSGIRGGGGLKFNRYIFWKISKNVQHMLSIKI